MFLFLHIHWNIDPEIVNLFGISIRYYGLLFMLGILAAIYLLQWMFKKEDIPQASLEKLISYGIIGIFAGARLGHCFFYQPDYFLAHPLEAILPIEFLPEGGIKFTGYRGLASHGGALGLILAILLYAHKTKQSVLHTLDLIAIVTPLTGFFIRLANFFNSEIIGLSSSKPWAIVFDKVDSLPRHPSQIYEAISYLLIFFLLIYLYKNKTILHRKGNYFGLCIALLFTARFIIEFTKEHQVAFEDQLPLDMGQLLSIPFILIGLAFVFIGKRKQLKRTNT